jgi:hypothetical protein
VYLALARSLLDGGYRDLFDPAAPAHVIFPPGFPAIVASALAVGVEPWAGIKLIVIAFSTIAVALTWFLLRSEGRGIATCVTSIVALSPGVISLSHWELSDVPFWALTTAALVAWGRVSGEKLRAIVIASILTACAYAIRTAGLPLLLASTTWLLLRRNWKGLAIHLLIVVPPAAGWYLWSGNQTGYTKQIMSVDPYSADPGALTITTAFSRIGENLSIYSHTHLPALFAGEESTYALLISIALLVLALAGWSNRIIKPDRGVVEIFFPLYAGVVLLWLPQLGGERLVLPLYALILFYAFTAIGLITSRAQARMRRLAYALPCIALLAPAVDADIDAISLGTECVSLYREGDRFACLEPSWRDFFALAAYSREALPAGSVILSRKPALVFAESGHRGRTYPYTRSPDTLFATSRLAGARYLLLDNLDEVATSYLTPVLIRRPAAFCVMHSLGPDRATLFGIRRAPDEIPDAAADPGSSEVSVSFQRCGPEYFASGVTP